MCQIYNDGGSNSIIENDKETHAIFIDIYGVINNSFTTLRFYAWQDFVKRKLCKLILMHNQVRNPIQLLLCP